MLKNSVIEVLNEAFKEQIEEIDENKTFPCVEVKCENLKEIISFCVYDTNMLFDFLENLTAIHLPDDSYKVIYQLYSMKLFNKLNISVKTSAQDPTVSSVSGFWESAFYFELEAAEMFGIKFEGHPDLKNFLLPENWQGFPLRKSYEYPKEFNGIEHYREPILKIHN